MARNAQLSATTRTLSARAAALTSWALTDDPTARTKPAREGFLSKLEAELDPEQQLDPDERRRRALLLRRAHMQRIAAKSVQVRAAKRQPA